LRKLRCLNNRGQHRHPVTGTRVDLQPVVKISSLTKRIRNLSCFCLFLFLTLMPHTAKAQGEPSLKPKHLRIVNTYSTYGLTDGRAVLGPDGCIWIGNLNGTLSRLDTSSNRVISEKKLKGGIRRCLKTFYTGDRPVLVVGTSKGLYCFGDDGSEFSYIPEPIGASNAREPIANGNELLILAEDGLIYILDKDCRLNRTSTNIPGAPTSDPALLGTPHRLAIYGVAVVGDFITQENRYQIVIAPLNSGSYRIQDVRTNATNQRNDGTEQIVATAVYQEHNSDIGLALTQHGKVFKVDHNGLSKNPLIDLKCSPVSRLIVTDTNRVALIGTDALTKRPCRYIFSMNGKLLSQTILQDIGGNCVENSGDNSESLAASAVSTDNGRLTALIGFSNKEKSCVRLIDVLTGLVLATLKIPGEIQCVSYLQGRDFFVAENSGPLPEELTKHYLVRVGDGQ